MDSQNLNKGNGRVDCYYYHYRYMNYNNLDLFFKSRVGFLMINWNSFEPMLKVARVLATLIQRTNKYHQPAGIIRSCDRACVDVRCWCVWAADDEAPAHIRRRKISLGIS